MTAHAPGPDQENSPEGEISRYDAIFRVICVLAVLAVLYLISGVNYLLFHGIVEIAGIAVAFTLFIIVWNTRRQVSDGFFLIIGISFFFFGVIDLVHTLAYKGMGIFPGNSADLPTQLWIAARYFQSCTFLVATLFIGRSITRHKKYDALLVFSACTAVCALIFASIFVWQNFPACFVEGRGLTPFKVNSEYFISFILLATTVILYLKRDRFIREVWELLIGAQVLLILGELAFTSYISVFGFMNMLGHLFRFLSVYLFYRAFVVISLTRPYDLLLRDLHLEKKALFESEMKYRTLFTNMLEGVAYCRMIYDKEGKPVDWVYLDVNRSFERLTGLENVVGKRVLEVIPDIKRESPEIFGIYGRVASRGIPEEVEITFAPLHLDLQISVFSPEPGYFVAVFWDISDRKRAENAIILMNRKLHLLSNITRHDINNQILSLKAYLELSKEYLDDSAKMSEVILREERLVLAIERQILFTREYQDLGVKAPTWQNVRQCVLNAAAGLQTREVLITLEIPDTEVFADPLFEKVFYNLIDNALRYGGPVMTTITISAQETDAGLEIIVMDNGAGIPPDHKSRIFERGFGNHTGLGLYLSREILTITGIGIEENGEHGTGARFIISVPPGGYRMVSGVP